MRLVSPTQLERLALLSEECGEVQQAIGKILRFGLNTKNPEDENKTDNRNDLEKELGNVLAAIRLLSLTKDINIEKVYQYEKAKLKKLPEFLQWYDNVFSIETFNGVASE